MQPTIIDPRRSLISADIDAYVDEARAVIGGDFARGQRLQAGRVYVYGDFASGLRTITTPVAIHHVPSAERALPLAA